MADDVTQAAADAITEALSTPQKMGGDAGYSEQRPIADLIAAANYLAALNASKARGRGLRFSRLIPDGTVHAPHREDNPLGWR